MFRRTSIAVATAAVAAATAVAVPGTAHADFSTPAPCVESHKHGGFNLDVKLCGVSDVDQDRVGLEATGLYYCGPASLFNVLYYFNRQKGAPLAYGANKISAVEPKDPAHFEKTTSLLERIGVEAKYEAPGTSSTNLRHAFTVAAKPAADADWTVATGHVDSKDAGDFSSRLASRLSKGPVQLQIGFYRLGVGSFERENGHFVTVTAMKGQLGGDELTVSYADPALAGDKNQPGFLYTQSTYRSETATLERKLIKEYLRAKDDPATPADESVTKYGTWRHVERWALSGVDHGSNLIPMVEGFNWFVLRK